MAKDHKKKLKREKMKAKKKEYVAKANSLDNNFSNSDYSKGKTGLYIVVGIFVAMAGFIFYSLS